MTGFLDMRTVLIGYALSAAMSMVVIVPVWHSNRERNPEMAYWVADYVLQFLGLALIAARGLIPDFLSMVVANAFMIGGTILLYVGLRRYVGRPGNQYRNVAMLTAFTGVQTYYSVLHPNLTARNVNISAALLFITVQCAWLLLVQADKEAKPATRGVGGVMLAYAAVSLLRIVVDLAQPPATTLMASGIFDTVVTLAYALLFIALTFAILLMVNATLVRELRGDIIIRRLAEHRLRELSERDPLTGLLNSRAFEREATERLRKIRGSHASLIYLDVDYLKEINDGFGHPTGDVALVAFADVLRRAFRESDVIGRLGGDEFAVLAVSREVSTSETLVARFQSEIARLNGSGQHPFRIAASVGVASWDLEAGAPDLQTLVRLADERMYRAKREHHERHI